MSVQGIHWAQKVRGETMCPFRKALLYALGERHNIDTGLCMPDQEMLARDAGMSSRTVRKYAAILEKEGFIERRKSSRGNGTTTYYVLNFEVMEAQKVATDRNGLSERQRHNFPVGPTGTPVPVPTGTPVPVPTGSCVPVHKKKHESNTKKNTNTSRPSKSRKAPVDETAILDAFETMWGLWPRKGRERSRSKAFVLDQLRRSSKILPVGEIVEAVRVFVQRTDAEFVPALDRWLQQGRFEHFLPKAPAEPRVTRPSPAQPAGDGIDWAEMVARYVRSGIWPNRLGDRPDEIGYRGALEPLEAIMANGKVGLLNVQNLKINIDRLRAARAA